MGMTASQKILAAHAHLNSVEVGQLICADVDLALANDITGPVAIREFKKTGIGAVKNKDGIALVMDHFAPNKDIKSAEQCKTCRLFAREQDLSNFYDVGKMGIEHALLPELGLVGAGDLVIGADSHTCTYGALGAFATGVGSTDLTMAMIGQNCWFKVPSAIKFVLKGKFNKGVCGKDLILHIIGMLGVDGALYKSMEFTGDGIKNMNIDDRFTVCNMAIECGAKNAIFPVDEVASGYMKDRFKRPVKIYEADPDAIYAAEYTIDLGALKPTVAFPHLPENAKTPDEWGNISIDQVVIGSCTNGRISDMRIAAEVLKGRKAASGIRTIIIPATQSVYRQCIDEGLINIFLDAGAIVSTPTCGPCLGGYMGILAEGERCVSTTNRNFVGRMGHVKSEVYLASPYVAAASAVLGKLGTPDEL